MLAFVSPRPGVRRIARVAIFSLVVLSPAITGLAVAGLVASAVVTPTQPARAETKIFFVENQPDGYGIDRHDVRPDVDPELLGRRVVAHLGMASGGYAEQALASAASLHDIPDGLEPAAAVAARQLRHARPWLGDAHRPRGV